MPFGLGFFATAGVSAAGSYELIASEILTSSQSSVTFSNLGDYSSTYQHLQLRMSAKGNRGTYAQDVLRIALNGDTTLSNYGLHILEGNGSSVSSSFVSSENYFIATDGSQSPADAFGAAVIDILDPYENKFKTLRSLSGHSSPDAGGASGKRIWLSSLLWRNTNSLTSITISTLDSTLVAKSRFSLYGLKASA